MSPAGASSSAQPSRRAFGQGVAAAVVGGLAVEPAAAREPPADPAEALLGVLRARYGKHLTDDQLETLRHAVQHRLRRASAMNRVPLNNADEPVSAFRADLP